MTTAAQRGLMACRACGQLARAHDDAAVDVACPRCGAPLHARIPDSLKKAAALLVAAYLLYIPANILPVMETHSFMGTQSDTIWSGAVYLWDTGSWPLAVIVVIASIIVPLLKLVILTYLLASVWRSSRHNLLARAKLYRLVEFIGRWSMLDVYVVTVLAGVMQLALLANVDPGPGVLPFAAVVVLTLLASASFDPRLMWDREDLATSGEGEHGVRHE